MSAGVANKAAFDRIRYAQLWEDADVLTGALAGASGRTFISICSGGDNALAMLLLDPKRIVAIDLSAAPAAEIGSEVLLWGPQLPVERVAQAAGTIGYELVCGVTRRVQFADRQASEPVSAAA